MLLTEAGVLQEAELVLIFHLTSYEEAPEMEFQYIVAEDAVLLMVPKVESLGTLHAACALEVHPIRTKKKTSKFFFMYLSINREPEIQFSIRETQKLSGNTIPPMVRKFFSDHTPIQS